MAMISVIIPFYQKKTGILRRALQSISDQSLPDDVNIYIIVVDDGSPAPVAPELDGLILPPRITLDVVTKANGGVSSARNAGLAKLPADCDYVAFLDSDDIWAVDHLRAALAALAPGRDLYFSDNQRLGFHESYFQQICPAILDVSTPIAGDLREIGRDDFVGLLLRSFPSQISTVVIRRALTDGVVFDESFKMAGEDMVYILRLAIRADRLCFSTAKQVVCADGLNLYFSTMEWGSPQHIPRLVEELKLYKYLGSLDDMSGANKLWSETAARKTRADILFFMARALSKGKTSFLASLKSIFLFDKLFFLALPVNLPKVLWGLVSRTYAPR